MLKCFAQRVIVLGHIGPSVQVPRLFVGSFRKMSGFQVVEERLAGVKVVGPSDGLVYAECIGTHNGHFHCDEAFACGMLQFVEEFKGRTVVRTRDPKVIDQCHIVVDVGGTFEHDKKRYDHHQREFKDVFFSDNTKTKLSSAGLVYKFYGKEIIANLGKANNTEMDEELIDTLYEKLYTNFVEHIDGIDNGIDPFQGEKNYSITTHLSARVGDLNPAWNQENTTEVEMAQFKKAVQLTTTEFANAVFGLLNHWLPARSLVEKAIRTRFEADASGAIVVLDEACPWKSHLFAYEQAGFDNLTTNQLKYVLYPDSNKQWRIQCVPVEENSFTNRKSLPEPYWGLRDEALSSKWNIPDCIFVHASGFIGGNKTFQGALEMAKQSVQL